MAHIVIKDAAIPNPKVVQRMPVWCVLRYGLVLAGSGYVTSMNSNFNKSRVTKERRHECHSVCSCDPVLILTRLLWRRR